MLLEIKNFSANIGTKKILSKINAKINHGDVVAIIGPNGHGKSTLLKAIMGHYSIITTSGSIIFNKNVLNKMNTDERARLGLFLATQIPEEIPGVSNIDFIRAALNSRLKTPIKFSELFKKVQIALKDLNISPELLKRSVNEGFSGGEKKKNEIFQLKIINPECAMLDEIDSGLDVDALKIIVDQLQKWLNENKNHTLIIVSHYKKLYKLIKPNKVFLMINGTIVKQGDYSLIKKIDSEGYEWIKKKLKINFKDNSTNEIDFLLEDTFGKNSW